jgi:mono/diheme cytochrome c family protein
MPTPAGEAVTYTNTIGPLLQARCGSCHGSAKIQGLNLTGYQTALAGGQSGPAIVPGDPQASLLVQKQNGEQPHFGQLTPEELDLVVNWIAVGAPEK